MKFHEALRRAVRQFGINVLQEHRLMSVLADYKAFEDYPAVKEVMKAVSAEGHGKELCRLAMDGSDEECLRYADDMKKSLVRNSSFREEFAQYAAESLVFALGLRTSVQEPSDHGFEAVRRKNEPERAAESGRGRQRTEARAQAAPQYTEKRKTSAIFCANDPEELYRLGQKYFCGLGTKQDLSKAAEYYRAAAERGNTDAAKCLGFMYSNGQGVEQDSAEAARWFSYRPESRQRTEPRSEAAPQHNEKNSTSESSEVNESEELYRLGQKYFCGLGTKQDLSKAAEYYRAAAKLGSRDAAKCLGFMYSNGQGVARDYAEAARWFSYRPESRQRTEPRSEAAPQHNEKNSTSVSSKVNESEELYRLGQKYYCGLGTRQDLSKAAEYYRAAAKLGCRDAAKCLGFMYSNGQGVVRDYSEAARWFSLSQR